MAKVLPPGLSASTFSTALKEMRAVVGSQWVFDSEDDLDTYRDPYSLRWGDPDEYLAAAAVAPDTVEQVQAIVRIANQYRFPLYPISTGKNLTYGAAAPTFTGSVVLDLKRMNRVLRVDEKRAFALVEPGVSYFDLYRYIKDRNLKVWIDCPDPGWGSPIGNALDHGIGYTSSAFRDHFGSHCGMEVVLPTGEVMRTGMGALPSADSWQDYRYGVGPYVDGLFTQANFGIVTKMGFWLLPQPETWLSGTVTVPNYNDFGPLVEHVSYLEDSQLMTGLPNYSSPLGGRMDENSGADIRALMADGWPSAEKIDAYVRSQGKPAWQVRLQFYGPAKTVMANWEYAQERIGAAIPGSKFQTGELLKMPLTPEQEKTHHLVNFGIPNMVVFSMIARRQSEPDVAVQGHVDFLTIVPRLADAVHKANRVIYDTQKAQGVQTTATPFGTPITWYHRCFLVGAPTTINYRDDRTKNKKAREVFEAYVKNMAAAGFGEYRTNSAMQGLLVDQYSFGDHALLRFQERLKDAADPNGIISPGRYGIWPKHLRSKRA
jgi:4-cresol dehydrogenase (hydroxylating)